MQSAATNDRDKIYHILQLWCETLAGSTLQQRSRMDRTCSAIESLHKRQKKVFQSIADISSLGFSSGALCLSMFVTIPSVHLTLKSVQGYTTIITF
jgi:hypothetical protein